MFDVPYIYMGRVRLAAPFDTKRAAKHAAQGKHSIDVQPLSPLRHRKHGGIAKYARVVEIFRYIEAGIILELDDILIGAHTPKYITTCYFRRRH